MRLYKTEGEGGRGNKGAIRCEALYCDCTEKSYNGITHHSIECTEEATWEGPNCNSKDKHDT